MICPCLMPDVDPDNSDGLCDCGHAVDEHTEQGDCTVALLDI